MDILIECIFVSLIVFIIWLIGCGIYEDSKKTWTIVYWVTVFISFIILVPKQETVEILMPDFNTPNTIDININDRKMPIKDLFLESYLNKEETHTKKEAIITEITIPSVSEVPKVEENKQENEQVTPPKMEEAEQQPVYTAVNETVYATSDVNIRKGPGTNYDKLGKLQYGESITRVGVGNDGWSKVIYNNEEAYISSNYLTKTKPDEKTQEETKPSTDKPYNVLNSSDSYSINKGFKNGNPSIKEEFKQYALDIINIIENCTEEKYTYSFEVKEGEADIIVSAICIYIDEYYDPLYVTSQIAHNGVYRYGILEDGTLHIEIDILPEQSRKKIAEAKTTKDFIANAANSLNLNGNKVHDLKLIHDFVCKKASYDYSYASNLNSIYSLATTGKTRCAGYSKTFKAICDYVGLSCKYVVGYSDGDLHAWNSVTINGNTYYIDTTWNDTIGTDRYFLMTAEQLSKDHSW